MAFGIIVLYCFFLIVALTAGANGKLSLERKDINETLEKMNSKYIVKLIFCLLTITIAAIVLYDWFSKPKAIDGIGFREVTPILSFDYYGDGIVVAGVFSFMFLIGWLIWLITNINHQEKNRRKLESLISNKEKREIEAKRKKEQKEQKEQENNQILSELTLKCGKPEKIIKFWGDSIKESFIVFPSTRNIYVNRQIIPYDNLVGCEIKDNSKTVTVGNIDTVTEIRSNNGSTVGRAVVGGLAAGPVGAIIGGTTSSQTAKTKVIDNRKTIVQHHYYAIISLSTISDPTISVDCGIFGPKFAEEIKAVILGIVSKRQQEGTAKISIADELVKLADLKEKGLLTQEEFEQQKQKLLAN